MMKYVLHDWAPSRGYQVDSLLTPCIYQICYNRTEKGWETPSKDYKIETKDFVSILWIACKTRVDAHNIITAAAASTIYQDFQKGKK